MKEAIVAFNRDVRTAGVLVHSILKTGRVIPNIGWWDQASKNNIKRVVDRLSLPNDRERLEINKILKSHEVESVLDVGCGPATEYLSFQQEDCLNRIEYTGLDRSQTMLDVAQERFPGLATVRGDVESLPFGRGSYDAVIIKHVLEHQPEGFKKTITEAARVARKYVIIDFFHALLPITIKINDARGYANNWYCRKDFESFLTALPFSKIERTKCSGSVGQLAEIYTLVK